MNTGGGYYLTKNVVIRYSIHEKGKLSDTGLYRKLSKNTLR